MWIWHYQTTCWLSLPWLSKVHSSVILQWSILLCFARPNVKRNTNIQTKETEVKECTVLTIRKQAPIKMALNFTSKSRGTTVKGKSNQSHFPLFLKPKRKEKRQKTSENVTFNLDLVFPTVFKGLRHPDNHKRAQDFVLRLIYLWNKTYIFVASQKDSNTVCCCNKIL